jgi:Amt family ammonium transporter
MSLPLTIVQETSTAELAAAVAQINGDMGMLWMLISGILVFLMQAGFTLVESGMTRSKNVVNIAMKNILDIAVGSIVFWFVGYSLMYGESASGWIGWSGFMFNQGPADLFFQTVFCATTATIVSGAIAGRTKYSTYIIFSVVLTAVIYPIAGGWEWNGGWLNNTTTGIMPAEFIDFAGSSVVHAVGGWAALIAAILVGPRLGKYINGKAVNIPGHNKLLATLGVFILWFGWFGFNGGSQLAWGGDDAVGASMVVLVTNLAACAGAIGALALTWIKYGKPNLDMTLNGALAGLVSITAGCGNMTEGGAILAGLIGGLIVVYSMDFVEHKLKVDDAVGAFSVHAIGGLWGTVVIGLWGVSGDTGIGIFNGGGSDQLVAQLIGAFSYAAWAVITSLIFLLALKKTLGLRVTEQEEIEGLDLSEHGALAYPGERVREIAGDK